MALICNHPLGGYHRVDDITINDGSPVVQFTLYSWPSESDRRKHRRSVRSQWEFPAVEPTAAACYEAIAMHPDFKGATSDDGEMASGLALAVVQAAGRMKWSGTEWIDPRVETLEKVRAAAVSAIDSQIAEHERAQARAVRDALLALANGETSPDALAALQAVETAVEPLRAKRAAVMSAESIDEIRSAVVQ